MGLLKPLGLSNAHPIDIIDFPFKLATLIALWHRGDLPHSPATVSEITLNR